MSLLKAIKAQLGLSNTPANNFTITAEADNGTLKLARGNAGATTQDILTVDASGKVSAPNGYNDVFGSGQSWQTMTGSRAINTSYTNSSGKPISVIVGFTSNSAAGFGGSVVIDGVTLPAQTYHAANAGYVNTLTFIVPIGATYKVNPLNNAMPNAKELHQALMKLNSFYKH